MDTIGLDLLFKQLRMGDAIKSFPEVYSKYTTFMPPRLSSMLLHVSTISKELSYTRTGTPKPMLILT